MLWVSCNIFTIFTNEKSKVTNITLCVILCVIFFTQNVNIMCNLLLWQSRTTSNLFQNLFYTMAVPICSLDILNKVAVYRYVWHHHLHWVIFGKFMNYFPKSLSFVSSDSLPSLSRIYVLTILFIVIAFFLLSGVLLTLLAMVRTLPWHYSNHLE